MIRKTVTARCVVTYSFLPAALALALSAGAAEATPDGAASRPIVVEIESLQLAGAIVAPSAAASDGKVAVFETTDGAATGTLKLQKGSYWLFVFARAQDAQHDATFLKIGEGPQWRLRAPATNTVTECVVEGKGGAPVAFEADKDGDYAVVLRPAETGVELDRMVVVPQGSWRMPPPKGVAPGLAVFFGRRLEPKGRAVLHGAGQDHRTFVEYSGRMGPAKPALYMAYVGFGRDPKRQMRELSGRLARLEGQYVAAQIGTSLHLDKLAAEKRAELVSDMCEALAGFPFPVYWRLGFEFNGHWNGYRPDQYKKDWIEVVTKLRSFKSDHVAVVWCYAPDGGDTDYMAYYPGDEHVDWWGIDLFAAQDISAGSAKFLEDAQKRRFPVMIGESSPRWISARQGEMSWRVWFQRYFDLMDKHPHIKAFCYIAWNWADRAAYEPSPYSWHWWGDARVWLDGYVFDRWCNELEEPQYIHSLPREDLRSLLGLDQTTRP